MDLSCLPQELVDYIAEFLSVEDISSCARVSLHWRDLFNNSNVWKQFCTFNPGYFFNVKSHLEFNEDVGFFTGCNAKETFIKEVLVKRNLLNCKYDIKVIGCGNIYYDTMLDAVDDAGNHWLFVSCTDGLSFNCGGHSFQVWNLNNIPTLHDSDLKTPLSERKARLLHSKMVFNNSKLFYSCDGCVLVYEFGKPLYKLKFLHKIVFEPLIKLPQNRFFNMEKLIYINGRVLGVFYSSFHIAESIPPYLHVWNEDGTLIFTDYADPINPEPYRNYEKTSYPTVQISSNDIDTVVVVHDYYNKELNSYFHNLRVFNIKLLHYNNFILENSNSWISIDLCKKVVAILFIENKISTLQCYDSENGKSLFKMQFEKTCNLHFHLISGNGYGEILIVNYNTLSVFDVLTNKEISKYTLFDRTYLTNRITLLKHSLCAISISTRLSYSSPFIEIWNYKSGHKLFTLDVAISFYRHFPSSKFSFIKEYSTPPKLILYRDPEVSYIRENQDNKIIVVSFW